MKTASICLAACLAATAAHAADVDKTVAQKNGWASYQTELNRIVDKVNGKCGGKLAASYDKSTYPEFDPIQDRTQSACQQAVGTLEAMCASDAGKSAVQALRSATCEYSTSGTGVSVGGGAMKVKIDPKKTGIVGKKPGSYSWKGAIEESL